ncbi:unnamed protein product [Peniophora sp. CBMAI 1063]|nr:unnamed protein product [Peniophora sp. CBMAI 1063]
MTDPNLPTSSTATTAPSPVNSSENQASGITPEPGTFAASDSFGDEVAALVLEIEKQRASMRARAADDEALSNSIEKFTRDTSAALTSVSESAQELAREVKRNLETMKEDIVQQVKARVDAANEEMDMRISSLKTAPRSEWETIMSAWPPLGRSRA